MEQYSFEKLIAYQKARKLVADVYHLIAKLTQSERFALCDQLRRSIISVPSNIAEDSGRISVKEKMHFIEIAYGSLMESYCQIQLAQDLGNLTEEDILSIKEQFADCSKLISGLKKFHTNAKRINSTHNPHRHHSTH